MKDFHQNPKKTNWRGPGFAILFFSVAVFGVLVLVLIYAGQLFYKIPLNFMFLSCHVRVSEQIHTL